MARTGRSSFSDAERAELWRLWKAGESQLAIGVALDKHSSAVFAALAARGGFAPPVRLCRAGSLCAGEREEISRGLAEGRSLRWLGLQLGRAASSISREVSRNGGRQGYRAVLAGQRAADRALRPKPCLLALNPALCTLVGRKLAEKWSPQQIAGWLKVTHPGDPGMNVSHETIYKSLFIQARGLFKKELLAQLRRRRQLRHGKTSTRNGQPRGQIVDAVPIRERPAEVGDRALPGHWEGDLLSGGKNTHIATLVERKSRFVMLVKVDGKDSDSVISGLIRAVQTLPRALMISLTWDRGTEMAQHKRFALATDVSVYFCDPKSPWQRGSNENTNGLLRQYFPKGCDLSACSQADLDQVARSLNTRPRKTLGFQTPAAILNQTVALTS